MVWWWWWCGWPLFALVKAQVSFKTELNASLNPSPKPSSEANLLRNVALSSTRAGLLHDAVAAAAASLRLQFHAKAFYHLAHALALLGELELSEEVLSQTGTQTGTQAAMTQLTEEVATTKGYVSLKYPSEMVAAAATMCRWPGKFMVDWVSEAIVIERVARKGRGVRSAGFVSAYRLMFW